MLIIGGKRFEALGECAWRGGRVLKQDGTPSQKRFCSGDCCSDWIRDDEAREKRKEAQGAK